MKLPHWIKSKHVFRWIFSSKWHQFNAWNSKLLSSRDPLMLLHRDHRSCDGNLPHTTAHHCSLLSHQIAFRSTSCTRISINLHKTCMVTNMHICEHSQLTCGHAHIMRKPFWFAQTEFCACQLFSMETLMTMTMRWWLPRFTLQTNRGLALFLHSLFSLTVH